MQFEVADSCTAIRIDNDIYYFDSTKAAGSKFVKVDPPASSAAAWTEIFAS